jgi:hypothetical protein
MEASGQLYAPTDFFSKKERRYPMKEGWVDHRASLAALEKEQNLLRLPGIEPRLAELPAYSLVAVPSTLSRLVVRSKLVLFLQHTSSFHLLICHKKSFPP